MAAPNMVTAVGTSPEGQGPLGTGVNAEDVLDLIVDKSPWENPVVTLMPKVEAMSTRHEWTEDSLNTVDPRHGVTEGEDFGGTSVTAETIPTKWKLANYLQHFRYEVKVSNLQRLMNPYGIADQYQYEVGKRAKQIGKDIEGRLLQDVFVNSGAAATYQGLETDPVQMKPLLQLIAQEGSGTGGGAIAAGVLSNIRDAATLTGLTAAASIWNGTTPAIAANTRISETVINKALELQHGNLDTGGGVPDMAIVSPATFGHIGAFGAAGTGQYPFPSAEAPFTNARLARAVRFYDSQFGLIEVVNSRWCPQATNTGTATTFVRGTRPHTETGGTAPNHGMFFLLERNRFRLAFGRPIAHVPLPPNGDSTRGFVLGDVTCELLGWQGAFAVVAVNNV